MLSAYSDRQKEPTPRLVLVKVPSFRWCWKWNKWISGSMQGPGDFMGRPGGVLVAREPPAGRVRRELHVPRHPGQGAANPGEKRLEGTRNNQSRTRQEDTPGHKRSQQLRTLRIIRRIIRDTLLQRI